MLLAGCSTSNQESKDDTFDYTVEQFADLQLLRYKVHGFEQLPLEEKKFVYTLEYFDEDAKKGLSAFFKNNGEPLISMVPDALNAIGAGKYVEHYATLLPMYDPDSEVSIDYSVIGKVDEEFASIYNSDELLRLAAKYILKNKEIFLA